MSPRNEAYWTTIYEIAVICMNPSHDEAKFVQRYGLKRSVDGGESWFRGVVSVSGSQQMSEGAGGLLARDTLHCSACGAHQVIRAPQLAPILNLVRESGHHVVPLSGIAAKLDGTE